MNSVGIDEVAKVLDFEFVYRGDRTDIEVTTSENRPGLLPVCDYFASDRIQVLGKTEAFTWKV